MQLVSQYVAASVVSYSANTPAILLLVQDNIPVITLPWNVQLLL